MSISRMIERPATLFIGAYVGARQYIRSIRRVPLIQEHVSHGLELVLWKVAVLVPLTLFYFYLLFN